MMISRACTMNTRFNPTMVRFKVFLPFQLLPVERVSIPQWFDSKQTRSRNAMTIDSCFNPTMVRFKVEWFYDSPRITEGFNPTMVRFKGASRAQRHASNFKFQSHNGSIQSWKRHGELQIKFRFQSHNGSIQSPSARRVASSVTMFQSHNGSIQRRPF